MKAAALRQSSFLFFQDVYKSYGSKVVLDDIDLAVAQGEIVTVQCRPGAD
jgi:NitT/TauT family transport system ATP-binding protein